MKRVLLVCASVAISLFALTPSAGAWGGTTASRPCGVNTIWSNASYNNAATQKASGTCAGRLSVAMRKSNGASGPRNYGDNNLAYTGGGSSNVGGFHWGCDACSASAT